MYGALEWKGKMPAMPPGTPAEISQMTANIWNMNPESRPTMDDLCRQLRALNNKDFSVDKAKLTTRTDMKSKSESAAVEDSDSLRSIATTKTGDHASQKSDSRPRSASRKS
ncbi:hypothetical protein GCK32_005086 [Trichostrongylus colubriformis]|uniref:Serine-threonine/tyrosine-protein kinase catalytic domain-containing protein n=1 Tax=Trichostrongylus colubriformis TaxID=6319 RepID=A0AAN8EZP6_TRICO